MRRWGRLVLCVVGAVIAFALLFPVAYALIVTVEQGPAPVVAPVPDGTYHVYVVDWGYHTAIVVPQPIGFALGPPGNERAPYLEYAWGDKRFYMESDFNPWSVFATLVLPTASVLYLEGHSNPPSFAGARGVYVRDVNATTLRALFVELERTIERERDGERSPAYAEHEGYRGRFYPAHGRYLWTRDCNWWTVQRLRATGLAGNSAGVVLSRQVAGRLRAFHLDVGVKPRNLLGERLEAPAGPREGLSPLPYGSW